MEGCLLCLEKRNNLLDAIVINSNKWDELNVNNILKKYLWPMNHIDKKTWLCTSCWKELYEFHTFYVRIEEVHLDCGLLTKNVMMNNKESLIDEMANCEINALEDNSPNELGEIPAEELKDVLYEYDLNHVDLQSDVQVKIEKQETTSKDESLEETLSDKNPLLQKRKRGRPRKDTSIGIKTAAIDLNKTKAHQKYKTNEICQDTGNIFDSASKVRKCQEIKVKDENNLINTTETLENDNDFKNDSDLESLANSENKSSINTNCHQKNNQNQNEKDKFLAENFKITCFLCKIPFETFFSMCKHFDKHHTERGHIKCCNKKFYRRSVLVDHVHYHLNPNYFMCSQCGKVMADRRCLELHVETHESNQEKNHCCDICGKGFAKLGVLKKHRMIHLSEEEKRFSCSECNKNFASNYLLSSHYRSVHLKKYVKICDICGKSIRCKDVFERHMLQHEGKTVPSVNCDICGLVLTDKKALKRHKDIIHPVGGQHQYTCSMCAKISPNLKAHKRHVQYKHVMGYDHKCTICDKAFKRAPTLKEHMASHTGTILYTCPWCPKTFNSNANMHNHRKKVHPKEWEEASRKRYSGNLPPNYKPPIIAQHTDAVEPID